MGLREQLDLGWKRGKGRVFRREHECGESMVSMGV